MSCRTATGTVAIRYGAGSIEELPAILASRRAVLVIFPEAEGLGPHQPRSRHAALDGIEDRMTVLTLPIPGTVQSGLDSLSHARESQ